MRRAQSAQNCSMNGCGAVKINDLHAQKPMRRSLARAILAIPGHCTARTLLSHNVQLRVRYVRGNAVAARRRLLTDVSEDAVELVEAVVSDDQFALAGG